MSKTVRNIQTAYHIKEALLAVPCREANFRDQIPLDRMFSKLQGMKKTLPDRRRVVFGLAFGPEICFEFATVLCHQMASFVVLCL